MKIATWNVERLRHKKALDAMLHSIHEVNADILVLTETDRRLRPRYRFYYETPGLAGCQPDIYAPTENRVSIYTNSPCICRHSTYDENTALCVELETEKGSLIVYGTIIGIYGNRHRTFLPDLTRQMDDLFACQGWAFPSAFAETIIAALVIITILLQLGEQQF